MKRLNLLFIVFFFLALSLPNGLLSASAVRAASPSPDPLGDLKERIASRVAQLKLVEKRGIIGKVTDVSMTQITLTDTRDETRFVDVDELTKFEGESNDFGISDIRKGQSLGILGLYNKQSRRLLARVVTEITVLIFLNGVVESLDSENFSLKVVTEEDKVFTIDVEKTTKTFSYTKDEGLIKSGFSKIEVGQNVIVSGTLRILEKNRIIADRILIFPDIPKNPKVSIEVIPTFTPSAVPSTGSGKKLTPITR